MKSFIITILVISSFFLTNHYSQEITATLAGNTSEEGFSVVNADEETLLRITGEGNVGIGTSTPTNLFEVNSGSALEGNLAKSIVINAQNSSASGVGGSITLRSGSGQWGGDLNLYSGFGGDAWGGDINIITGGGGFEPGDINIKTVNTNNMTGGDITISTDDDDQYKSGDIIFSAGDGQEIGGSVLISAGDGWNGANIELTPGQQKLSGIDGLVKVIGSGTYSGTWTQASDERFKKNIKPLENNLSSILELSGVSYEFKTDEYPERNFSKGKQIGLIAQDVEEVLPELVETDSEGYKSIAYQNMVPVLIEAIKEQQIQIENLSEKIETLEKQISRNVIEVSSSNK